MHLGQVTTSYTPIQARPCRTQNSFSPLAGLSGGCTGDSTSFCDNFWRTYSGVGCALCTVHCAGTFYIIRYEKGAPCSCSVHTLSGCTQCSHPFGAPTLMPWADLHTDSTQTAGVFLGCCFLSVIYKTRMLTQFWLISFAICRPLPPHEVCFSCVCS